MVDPVAILAGVEAGIRLLEAIEGLAEQRAAGNITQEQFDVAFDHFTNTKGEWDGVMAGINRGNDTQQEQKPPAGQG